MEILSIFKPHEVNLAALAKPKKKKSEETNVAPATVSTRKYTTPIVQLMPPPPKVRVWFRFFLIFIIIE